MQTCKKTHLFMLKRLSLSMQSYIVCDKNFISNKSVILQYVNLPLHAIKTSSGFFYRSSLNRIKLFCWSVTVFKIQSQAEGSSNNLWFWYFRALKTRGNTPKYGLIFHSTFIGRAGAKNKGRISRYLANKCSIASRIDCFSGKFKSQLSHVAKSFILQ